MGLRRLTFLLLVTFALAACGDNKHREDVDDAGTDMGSNVDPDASVDAPPDALTCTAPQIKCGDMCVDPRTDNDNCGMCGIDCGAGTCQTNGSSSICCPAGQTNCGGQCVDLTNNPDHCGMCGTDCGTGTCQTSGSSTMCCPTGQTNCNGQCVDLQTDEGFCGSCTNACGGAADTCCGGNCIDEQNDENNCGTCGTMCTGGDSCVPGTPATCCGAGEANCNGVCTTIAIDNNNCGGCGNVCNTGAGQSCTAPDTGTMPACCTAAQNNCNGTCSDPMTDEANCGGCAGGGGDVCDPGETCTSGVCCGPGEINCNGVCVDPLTDNGNCGGCGGAGGDVCSGGTPVCSGGECDDACGPGETNCSNDCANTDSDPNNCGACGNACAANEVCNNGTCGTMCAAGEAVCNGACVNTQTDPNHCGGCGPTNVCAPTDECVNGQCVLDCPSGETLCNGVCRNLLLDNNNCGMCGMSCGTGTCQGGMCCPAGQTNCNGVCKDLTQDETACGTCNTACTAGQTCDNGTGGAICCGPGTENCSGTCSDVSSDENNCGGCGLPCGAGETCDSGVCCPAGQVNTGGICCPIGFDNCGGQCVNTDTSSQHCSQCGMACGQNEFCDNGTCSTVCNPPNETTCGPCTDIDTDPDFCGTGCVDCPTGAACVGGACGACPAATPDTCNGACVNLDTDPANCGTCNNFCGAGQTCTDGVCCSIGQTNCNGQCVDITTDPNNCGGCAGAGGDVCGSGSTCDNGSCECGFGQQLCPNGQPPGCKTTDVDPTACGDDCLPCPGNKPYCVSGGCVADCPAPLSECGSGANAQCVNLQSDTHHCGTCAIDCDPNNTGAMGCSAGQCVPAIQVGNDPAKCVGGGPPIVVPTGGGGDTCTGNLGATAFTFGLCSRTNMGPLSQAVFTDAFDSTVGPYVSSCTTDANCSPKRCSETDTLCTDNTQCTGGTDVCQFPVKCVGGTCVGGGVGVNGTVTPVASNSANTHVGGDFWVFGVTGLAIKGNTQIKQRFFNQGSIDISKTTRVFGTANVKGPWSAGGNADMTIDGLLTTEASCPPLPSNTLHLNGGCTTGAFPTLPVPCGTQQDLIPVRAIVEHFANPANNDNATIGLPYDVLDNPTTSVRLDLPCGYYYFNQMNIGKDTTIVVHGRTAIFVGGAVRVSQKLIFDLQPTATLDIFVGGVMNVSNVVTLGSPAYPRLSRMYFGSSSCLGGGSCSSRSDCCSGRCENGVCAGVGGGNLSQSISLSNGGFFNGLLWGGYGTFTHSNPLEMYGSIFTNYFDASGDTIVHYDIGATQTGEECEPPPPQQSCESCRDCNNQACVNNTCGACTSDAQCCPPLHCDNGTCRL